MILCDLPRPGRRLPRGSALLLPLLAVGVGCSDGSSAGADGVGSGGAAAMTTTAQGGATGSAGRGGTASQTSTAGRAPTAGSPGSGGATGSAGMGAMTGSAGHAPSGGTGGNVGGSSSGGDASTGGSGGSDVGGMGNASGSSATGGASATGGSSAASGGMVNTGGTGGGGAGGASGGSAGKGAAGQGAAGKSGTGGGTCGGQNPHPFGCKMAWGIADPGGSSYASYSYLDFMSYWVDSSISASGAYTTCNGCSWLAKIKNTNLVPVYVAYIIGYLGHSNGIVDGNQTGSKKLSTDGAQLIRDHRQQIVDAYAWYAQKTYAAWPDKPLVWMLEGDYVQYADDGQTNKLSYAELGTLAADITCAIKGNMPNAVVAIDQSSWDSDDVTNSFWGAMQSANVNYDMVWTTGVGNNQGYIESGTTDSTYNHATAKYSYLHTLTGKTIMVDTSAGASAAGDSWSVASSTDLNARVSEGVIAADITGTAPGNLQSNLATLRPELNAFSACP